MSAEQPSPSLEHGKRKQPKQRSCTIPCWIVLLIILIIIAMIVVPTAVVFGLKRKHESRPSQAAPADIIVPLYIYPHEGAWNPLFKAAERHRHLNFTAIINPQSGPGSADKPHVDYAKAVTKLNSYPNVRTVGYVSTSWTTRNLGLAMQEIKIYSAWSKFAAIPNLGMRGIFLDETPGGWTMQSQAYLEELANVIRGDEGFGRSPLIIHNPGMIPDTRYMPFCDISVVFEKTYSDWKDHGFNKTITDFQTSTNLDRTHMAAMVHSLPDTVSRETQKSFVEELRNATGSVFLTGLSVDYYSSFWEGWKGFVKDMAEH